MPPDIEVAARSRNDQEMDKVIRQIVERVRANYFENGETARGIPNEIKKIIEVNIDRL